jgi:hypothetical protein
MASRTEKQGKGEGTWLDFFTNILIRGGEYITIPMSGGFPYHENMSGEGEGGGRRLRVGGEVMF